MLSCNSLKTFSVFCSYISLESNQSVFLLLFDDTLWLEEALLHHDQFQCALGKQAPGLQVGLQQAKPSRALWEACSLALLSVSPSATQSFSDPSLCSPMHLAVGPTSLALPIAKELLALVEAPPLAHVQQR